MNFYFYKKGNRERYVIKHGEYVYISIYRRHIESHIVLFTVVQVTHPMCIIHPLNKS